MIDEIINRLKDNTERTLVVAAKLEEPSPLYRVSQGWNGIQILEHLLLTDRLIEQVIFSAPESIADKQFMIGDHGLRELLVEDLTPLESPPAVTPSGTLSREHLMIEYAQARKQLVENLMAPTDLPINRTYPNPFLGEMTLCDWLLFILYHTERHINQIKNLKGER